MALLVTLDLAQHLLGFSVIDTARLRLVAPDIFIFLSLKLPQRCLGTQLSSQPALEAHPQCSFLLRCLDTQFGQFALPFLGVTSFGVGHFLQHPTFCRVPFLACQVAVGSHPFHLTLPVLLQRRDKLSFRRFAQWCSLCSVCHRRVPCTICSRRQSYTSRSC